MLIDPACSLIMLIMPALLLWSQIGASSMGNWGQSAWNESRRGYLAIGYRMRSVPKRIR
jgi:hypothetical protein